MKKYLYLLFISCSISASVIPQGKKSYSDFTGDLNGDGYKDIVIANGTDYHKFYGLVKVFFGSSEGIKTTAGWTYTGDLSNYLESKYFANIIKDVNGDGMDELCIMITTLAHEKSGRSHQSIYLYYGKKENFGTNPLVLKIEGEDMNKYSLRDYFAFDYTGDGLTDILAVSSKRNYKLVDPGWTDTDKKLLLYRGTDTGINTQYEVLKEIKEDIRFLRAGDINNDGVDDMMTGEPDGKQLVWTQFFGSKGHTADKKPFTSYKLLVAPTSDRIYNNIAWDFNGDKYDDDYVMREDRSPLLKLKKPDSSSYTLEFYPGSQDGLIDSIVYTWKTKSAPTSYLNVTACGDLNNDGYGDFVLQQFTPNPKAIAKMEAFILWGGKDGLHLDTSDSFNKFFHSLKYVDYGVTSVIALGDINNDGVSDLLLGDITIAYGSKEGNFRPVELKFLE